jgi:hypothetical protein
MAMTKSTSLLVSALLLSAATWGCGSTGATNSGGGGSGGASGSGAGGGGGIAGNGATSGGGGTTGGSGPAGSWGTTGSGGGSGGGCDPNGPKCNNCKDDDGDGRIDAADPECVGPLDNDEATFATGIPGDNMDPCRQDCFFDGNSGAGDDGCDWNFKCDPASPGANLTKSCPYDSNYKNCPTTQSQVCLDTCRKVTPNGCDCFGCCLVPGANTPVYLASTCTAADFGDPVKCPPCTQVTACLNPCDHCEICVGKSTLPSDCSVPPPPTGTGGTSGGSGGTGGAGGAAGTAGSPCNAGATYCGPGGVACPTGSFCVTGCCIDSFG